MIAPTLLVGLGGTGSKIVCRVAEQITEEQRKRIGFTVFDTDINELNEIRENNPFVKTIQTSTKLSVGEYLNIDKHARDNWFPVNAILNSKTLTEGAGQVRAISRLALDTAIRAGNMDTLHNAISDLYKVETVSSDQALRVIIVSSLAGGTGSGLILPIALYIKNFLATRFQQSANIIRGFFILPEVFFEVIHGQSERNNLMYNAYATLRELDAFLMKGDGTLPKKYQKSVRMEFPRVGSTEFDEYNVRPYDFCFLFDAQNTSGRKLNNFNQYLDHAANCIYAQSIGPMNKRSNSSEDNTIRDLCAQLGRNRYAGAGCAVLKYPFEDISKYIALQWTLQTVSDQWLKFDKIFLEKQKENIKKQNEGLPIRDLDAAKDYISSVEQKAEQNDPFAQSIVRQCSIPDENGNIAGMRHDNYVSTLLKYIEEECVEAISEPYKKAEAVLRNVDRNKDDVWLKMHSCYQSELKPCKNSVMRYTETEASNLAYTIFKAQSKNITSEKIEYQLETYLRNEQNEFLHPNAVRYFLYKTLESLTDEVVILKRKIDKHNKFFKNFNQDEVFDDKKTNATETAEDLGNRKEPFKMGNNMNSDQVAAKEKLEQYLKEIKSYAIDKLQAAVIEEGIEYVKSIVDAFRDFYQTFEGKAEMIKRQLAEISKKYNQTAGKTTRYICASPVCLQKFLQRIPYTGSAINIDGKLADNIYSKIRLYAINSTNEKTKSSHCFDELFNMEIVNYFKTKMLKTYGQLVDMDIITAIEREVEFEHDEFDINKQEQYISQIIENTRQMSTPFIERPLGEQCAPISACTYSPDIEPHDDSPRAALISKELQNYGGTPDPDIDRYTIMFYQSIYGLRANKLSKFAPADPGIRSEGAYYKAYYELIQQITPTSGNTTIITPHIDRNWHLIVNMPDLDENNQKALETKIYRAFMLGLIYGKIKQKQRTETSYIYKLELQNCMPEEFVISNHTPCDLFYEILDALNINPVIVDKIINEIELTMRKELNTKISFADSELLKKLNRLVITEYGRHNEISFQCKHVSIFDIPTLLTVSTPDNDMFDLETAADMTRVFINEIHRYIFSMTDDTIAADTFGKFICSQYRIYNDNQHSLPCYQKMVWFIGEIKRIAHDRLVSDDLDDYVDILDQIEDDNEMRKESESYIDNDEEEAEINRLAGSTGYTGTANGERLISVSEHNAEIEELNRKHHSEMENYLEKMDSLQAQLQTLTQQMNAIKNNR